MLSSHYKVFLRFVLVLAAIMPAFQAFGISKTKNLSIEVPVRDAVFHKSLHIDRNRVAFAICNPEDSSVIAESFSVYMAGQDPSAMMNNTAGDYLIKVKIYDLIKMDDGRIQKIESEIYEPETWHRFSVPEGATQLTLKPIYINLKRQKTLNEVSVTASKVMFYHKGDTLIYNADAFVLPQGSMLDALIGQLPGVSINSSGVIMCNGKKIDNLLLNGKDLFNGNQRLMLENLGAYTVKDIAVYDKLGHVSEMFDRNMGDARHVMDVRLKKEYSYGFLLNAEGGYGTENRYLARLFGMWFANNFSLTAYATTNNLDDKGTPGQDDSAWSYNKSGAGVATQESGGLSYFFNGADSKFEFKGSVDASHSDRLSTESTSQQNYFSTGDTYAYSNNQSNYKDFEVKTSHDLLFKPGSRVIINLLPQFKYSHRNNHSRLLSVSLNEELRNSSMELLQSIYDNATEYRNTIINRSKSEDKTIGYNLEGAAEIQSDIKLNSDYNLPLRLSLKGKTLLSRHRLDRFSDYAVKWEQQENPGFDQNRYTKGYPTHREVYSGSAQLTKMIKTDLMDGDCEIKYEYDRTNEEETSAMYLLNQIPGYNDFGTLPSVSEYEPTFFAPNSYHTISRFNRHRVTPALRQWLIRMPVGGMFMLSAGLPIDIYDRSFIYDGRGINQTIDRRDYIVSGYVGILWDPSFNHSIRMNFYSESSPVNMTNLITANDISDPLNVFTGNPNLKNPRTYRANLQLKKRFPSQHTLDLDWKKVDKAVALGYLYNPQTGIRSGQLNNIDGNWDASASYSFDKSLRSLRGVRLSTTTSGLYEHSVDMYGTINADIMTDIPLRTVNTVTAKEDIRLDWQNDRHRASLFGDVRFNRYWSSDVEFTDFSSWVYNIGASAVMNLPHDWGISTDLALHCRRGFADQRLNTTDLVWNARVSKSILKGSLMFIVDGFDLLHRLSKVTYTINAQARTETVCNVIPSYIMFHVRWNFNKQPKR